MSVTFRSQISLPSPGSHTVWLYLFLPLLLILCCLTAPVDQCLAGEEYKEVSAPLLKYMMESDHQVVVVNVLSGLEYEMHHISGSINIPINHLQESDKLPADKNTPLVFYCMGHR